MMSPVPNIPISPFRRLVSFYSHQHLSPASVTQLQALSKLRSDESARMASAPVASSGLSVRDCRRQGCYEGGAEQRYDMV